jgi:hypothetical protein
MSPRALKKAVVLTHMVAGTTKIRSIVPQQAESQGEGQDCSSGTTSAAASERTRTAPESTLAAVTNVGTTAIPAGRRSARRARRRDPRHLSMAYRGGQVRRPEGHGSLEGHSDCPLLLHVCSTTKSATDGTARMTCGFVCSDVLQTVPRTVAHLPEPTRQA